MKSLFLEEPLQLGGLIALGLLLLTGSWFRSSSPTSFRALIAGLILAPLMLIMQAWIQTDREKLEQTIQELRSLVAVGDMHGIIELIDPQTDLNEGHTRYDFEEHASALLEKYSVKNPTVGNLELIIQDQTAIARFHSSCTISFSQGQYPVSSRWELHFKMTDHQWKIIRIIPLEIAQQHYHSLWEIN